MSFGAVAGITITIALILIMGVGLMSYVSSLVKNAYQIKVELRNDVESAIARMDTEMDRRGRALRKELGDDAAKLRDSVQQDNDRRIKEIEDRLQKTLQDLNTAGRDEKAATQTALADMRRRLKTLESDVVAIKTDLSRRAALGRALRDKDRADQTDLAEAAPSPAPAPAPAPNEAPAAASPPSPPARQSAPVPVAPSGGQRLQYGELEG